MAVLLSLRSMEPFRAWDKGFGPTKLELSQVNTAASPFLNGDSGGENGKGVDGSRGREQEERRKGEKVGIFF